MTDGIIFDVDGTIWNSTPTVEQAWNAALEKAGYEERVTAKRLQGLFGLPMDDIIADILPNADAKERADFAPLCFEYEHEYIAKYGAVVYDGIKEMLEQLSAKYPLFIVSNCQAGYIELMLEKTGFGEYITDHLCPGDTDLFKADNIRIINERNGLKNPVYVGDTQMDANACMDAGVPIVFAAYGFGKVEKPDYVINSPMELTKLF
ncbi:MAG: HAD family hydrolase [Lachnospiraceae bacterium]|nr:HAD family hydrolase [Candidatus Colinaster scatohippi]